MKDYTTHNLNFSDNLTVVNKTSGNSGIYGTASNLLSITSAQRYRYQNEIQSMMYTFGDVRNPFSTTTMLVEDIVHSQMIELLIRVSGIVHRRGARNISPEDLLFLLRHDVNRSARLKEFLSWKDVRKNAKATANENDVSGGTGSGVATSAADEKGIGDGDDAALVAEIEEDAKSLAAADSSSLNRDLNDSTGLAGDNSETNSTSKEGTVKAVQIGPKKRQLGLFWDLGYGLLADLPNSSTDIFSTSIITYDSRQDSTSQRESLRRLRHADLLTLSMTQNEYMEYSECRQASFTYKKARKFREWLVGGTARPGSLALATLAGGSARDLARLNDDTLEILGFLAYEIVQKITEVSLAVKYEAESIANRIRCDDSSAEKSPFDASAGTSASKTNTLGNLFGIKSNEKQGHQSSELPAKPSIAASSKNPAPTSPQKSPIQIQHVEEAYRRLISANLDFHHLGSRNLNKKRKFIL